MRLDSRSEELDVESASSLYFPRPHVGQYVLDISRNVFDTVGRDGQSQRALLATHRASKKQSWETTRIRLAMAGAHQGVMKEFSHDSVSQSAVRDALTRAIT